jgi:hypothetical protein
VDLGSPFGFAATEKKRKPKGLTTEEIIRSLVEASGNWISFTKPYVLDPHGQPIPNVPPDVLKQLWIISEEEAMRVSVAAAKIIGELPEQWRKRIEGGLQPLNLAAALASVYGQRIAEERLILHSIRRAYDAGFLGGREAPQPQGQASAAANGRRAGTRQQHPQEPGEPVSGDPGNSAAGGPNIPSGLDNIF